MTLFAAMWIDVGLSAAHDAGLITTADFVEQFCK